MLKTIVGESYVLTQEADLAHYGADWTKALKPAPLAVVLPGSTQDVSAVAKFCHDHSVAIVPSGGRTGLAGGAIAAHGELVVNLQRMNRILEVDDVGMTIRVEAGVTTQAVQQAAEDRGMFFALDLAAKGSCQIGGNLATNAGGLKLIRYGGAREQVIGLEAVLADGSILDLDHELRKNNIGYDLKQLLIGSEGTLGLITKATLRLVPRPGHLQLCCLAVESFSQIPQVLRACNQSGLVLTAFEFFDAECMKIVLRHNTQLRSPFVAESNYYVLIEFEQQGAADGERIDAFLTSLFESGLANDGVVASSAAEFRDLWSLRENISECLTYEGQIRKNDISIPIRRLSEFVEELSEITKKSPPTVRVVIFGHIGDGNVHLNYIGERALPREEFISVCKGMEKQIFELIRSMKGSISAEHGIGLIKKADLHFSASAMQIDLMRSIKRTLDPKGIMNPGKIFDL